MNENSYEHLERKLASADVEVSGAEVHGLFCGLFCGGDRSAELHWVEELMADGDPGDPLFRECRHALQELASQTREAVEGPGLGFQPVLPADERPLAQRAAALREWCQAFLYGLGLAGVTERTLSATTREVLADFSEMTRMDLDSMEEAEADEEAYLELTEFLWVAAMLIYEECAREKDPSP